MVQIVGGGTANLKGQNVHDKTLTQRRKETRKRKTFTEGNEENEEAFIRAARNQLEQIKNGVF
jgi:hypothetical protein